VIPSILFLAGATAVFLYFAWAIRYHFASTRMPVLMRIVSVLAAMALLTGIIAVLRAPPANWQLGLAAAGVLSALGIFHGAVRATRGRGLTLAFDPVAPPRIADSGPYRWVRHPFYLSYIVFWIALLVAAPVWPLAVLTAALVALYVTSAMAEERTLLASPQAEPYRAATRSAGFLWPRLTIRRGAR
jgi:protein-S-isoprenylcysteine O-methyltransferase Ste14